MMTRDLANAILVEALVDTFRQLQDRGAERHQLRELVAFFLGYDASAFPAGPGREACGVELFKLMSNLYAGAGRQRGEIAQEGHA